MLQKKVIGLLTIFTLLPPYGISLLFFKDLTTMKNGILHTTIRIQDDDSTKYKEYNNNGYTTIPIFIPKLENIEFSPYYWVSRLLKLTKYYNNLSKYLFVGSEDSIYSLSLTEVNLCLQEIMQEMYISMNLEGTHSFNRSVIAFLLANNIPIKDILNTYCLRSYSRDFTLNQQYFKFTNLLANCLSESPINTEIKNPNNSKSLYDPSPQFPNLKNFTNRLRSLSK
jgi:hypothetical protein